MEENEPIKFINWSKEKIKEAQKIGFTYFTMGIPDEISESYILFSEVIEELRKIANVMVKPGYMYTQEQRKEIRINA